MNNKQYEILKSGVEAWNRYRADNPPNTYIYLWGANLRGANLRSANLRGANLRGANLEGANLTNATYDITTMLKAGWGALSPALTLECMRWDATILPPDKAMSLMNAWKGGGACPMSAGHATRIINFRENRELWQDGDPAMKLRALWEAIAAEKNVKI